MKAFSNVYQLPLDSDFEKNLAIGISIIKTPHCVTDQRVPSINPRRRETCPTCTP
jgi:hypothetical protein